jgi:hypothetical protein
MAFDIYPGPGNAPFSANAGGQQIIPLTTQRTGPSVDPGYTNEMFIRVAMSPKGTDPTFDIAGSIGAIAGDFVKVPLSGTAAVYTDTTQSNYVADLQALTYDKDGSNLTVAYLIRIGFTDPLQTVTWKLRITNNEATTREFVAVVADTAAQTQKPWVDVATPATLTYDLLTGESVTESVHVANKGTGSVQVQGLTPPALPAGLTVKTTLPQTLGPTETFDLEVTFAPTGPGPVASEEKRSLVTNPVDTAAGTNPGHNKQVSVSAVAGSLEVVLLLDTSGSMGWDPKGNSLQPGDQHSRLFELVDGTGSFLDKLAHFGNGHGRFGIARFPQATPGNPSTFDVVPMREIPASMTGPQGDLTRLTATDNTPMGDGMDRVLNSATSYFGNDLGNRRWIVLMSDGAHNAGTNSPLEFVAPPQGTASEAASLNGRKIQLAAIGYGIKGFSNVQPELLAALQAGSFRGGTTNGGKIFAVDQDGTTATDLALALAATIKAGLTSLMGSSRDPDAVFRVGQAEARHDVRVTPYDGRMAFTLAWNTRDANRLRLELLTPGCELITPENAGQGRFQGVTFRGGGRSHAYYVDPSFLTAPNATGVGTWTMLVTVPGPIINIDINAPQAAPTAVYERYTYDVLMESTLLLRLEMDRSEYFAGDPIGVTARLTADGLPVRGASVVLSTVEPGQAFANWLAAQDVPGDALAQAQQRLAGQDASPVLEKTLAAQIAGFTFDPAKHPSSFALIDAAGTGRYRATMPASGVPERRALYVTALGTTADGLEFRRELQSSVEVLVRPEPAFTVLSINQTAAGAATVTVIPKDRFGNVLIAEPVPGGLLRLTARGGELSGSLVNNVDGSYRQELTFPPGSTPSVGLDYLGQTVVPIRPIPPLDDLYYVDEVLSFAPGVVREANAHADPAVALGTVAGKPSNQFVALGAAGRLAVAIRDHVIIATHHDDVTVFVHPEGDRRRYRVEAYDVRGRRWLSLGESPGVTQSFQLGTAGLDATRGIRIVDTSGRAKDVDGQPLTAPGACITGVGVVKIERHRRYGGRFCRWCRWWPGWPVR